MSDDEAVRMLMEARVLEACITIEAWYHGSFPDDRQALRLLRAQLKPVGDWLSDDTDAVVSGRVPPRVLLKKYGPKSGE